MLYLREREYAADDRVGSDKLENLDTFEDAMARSAAFLGLFIFCFFDGVRVTLGKNNHT